MCHIDDDYMIAPDMIQGPVAVIVQNLWKQWASRIAISSESKASYKHTSGAC